MTSNEVKDICATGQEIFFKLSKDKNLDDLADVPAFQMAVGARDLIRMLRIGWC